MSGESINLEKPENKLQYSFLCFEEHANTTPRQSQHGESKPVPVSWLHRRLLLHRFIALT